LHVVPYKPLTPNPSPKERGLNVSGEGYRPLRSP
jgi:hypothetical protein